MYVYIHGYMYNVLSNYARCRAQMEHIYLALFSCCQVGGPSQAAAAVYEEFGRSLPGFMQSQSSKDPSKSEVQNRFYMYNSYSTCTCYCTYVIYMIMCYISSDPAPVCSD